MGNDEVLSVESMKRLIWVALAAFVAIWIVGSYVKKIEELKKEQAPKIEIVTESIIPKETESIFDYVRRNQSSGTQQLPEGVETSPIFGTTPVTTAKIGGLEGNVVTTKALPE